MSYEMTWLVDQRILRIHIDQGLNLSEVNQMMTQKRALCERGQGNIYVIYDAADHVKMTLSMQDIVKMFHSAPPPVPAVKWCVFVSPSVTNHVFFNIIAQLTCGRNRAFTTLPDALAFIQQMENPCGYVPAPYQNLQFELSS
ncbi:MAG: hypothetical protein U0694_29575 [Anaerolineae bacterium]